LSNGYTTAQVGDVFNLLDWATALATKDSGGNGSFNPNSPADLALPTLPGGLGWDTSLFNSNGIAVVVVGVVPEPSRAMLVSAALATMFLRRRRRGRAVRQRTAG